VGLDKKRAAEVYDHKEREYRKQLQESNVFNLLFRHEPLRNSNEVWRGNKNFKCMACKCYRFFFCFFFFVLD
jgi:hypothetical protein